MQVVCVSLADGQDVVPSRTHRHQADEQQVLPAIRVSGLDMATEPDYGNLVQALELITGSCGSLEMHDVRWMAFVVAGKPRPKVTIDQVHKLPLTRYH